MKQYYLVCLFLMFINCSSLYAETGTVGYTGIANSQSDLSFARCHNHPDETYTADGDETVKWLYLYFCSNGTASSCGLALYSIDTNRVPVFRESTVYTLSTSDAIPHWDSVAVNISLDSGKTYALAIGNETGNIRIYYNNGSGGSHRSGNSSSTLTLSWDEANTSSAYYSMYFVWEKPSESQFSPRRRKIVIKNTDK